MAQMGVSDSDMAEAIMEVGDIFAKDDENK